MKTKGNLILKLNAQRMEAKKAYRQATEEYSVLNKQGKPAAHCYAEVQYQLGVWRGLDIAIDIIVNAKVSA